MKPRIPFLSDTVSCSLPSIFPFLLYPAPRSMGAGGAWLRGLPMVASIASIHAAAHHSCLLRTTDHSDLPMQTHTHMKLWDFPVSLMYKCLYSAPVVLGSVSEPCRPPGTMVACGQSLQVCPPRHLSHLNSSCDASQPTVECGRAWPTLEATASKTHCLRIFPSSSCSPLLLWNFRGSSYFLKAYLTVRWV